jgi:limonene-1,2-epoxide hydrolase
MLRQIERSAEDFMTVDSRNPENVVKRYLAAMEKMDFDAGLAHVADDCEYINGPNAPVRGPEGVRAELAPFFAPVLENQFIVRRQAVAGNTVFVERLDRHRLPQGWFELPVTGVFEVKNEKIVYWREYFNLATVVDGMTKLMQEAR